MLKRKTIFIGEYKFYGPAKALRALQTEYLMLESDLARVWSDWGETQGDKDWTFCDEFFATPIQSEMWRVLSDADDVAMNTRKRPVSRHTRLREEQKCQARSWMAHHDRAYDVVPF